MSWMPKISGRCAALNAAVAMLLGFVEPGYGQVHCPRPDSPCPCAADGMCYPKRDTWGNYKTQWHAWPGESMGLTPTRADGTLPDGRQLQPYIRPQLDQEDLRGPARPPRAVAPAEGAAAPAANGAAPPVNGAAPGAIAPAPAQPAAGAPAGNQEAAPPANDGLQLPGLPGLPDFGPQGSLQPLPQLEDGPPALPQGLSQAVVVQPTMPQSNQLQPAAPQATKQPTVSVVPTTSRFVTPTAAFDTSHLELSNPAAKNVQKSMDEDLQQAIYFEASDMPAAK